MVLLSDMGAVPAVVAEESKVLQFWQVKWSGDLIHPGRDLFMVSKQDVAFGSYDFHLIFQSIYDECPYSSLLRWFSLHHVFSLKQCSVFLQKHHGAVAYLFFSDPPLTPHTTTEHQIFLV